MMPIAICHADNCHLFATFCIKQDEFNPIKIMKGNYSRIPWPGRTVMTAAQSNMYNRFVELVGIDFFFYSQDFDGTIRYISPNIETILGTPPEAMINSKWYEVLDITGETMQQGRYSELIAEGGRTCPPYEMSFLDTNQEPVTLEFHERPFYDENGLALGIDGIAKNITEQKHREAESERIINKLNKALKDVESLQGIVPTCQFCKKVLMDIDDEINPESWASIETYLSERSNAALSHTVCPDCMRSHYGEEMFKDYMTNKKKRS